MKKNIGYIIFTIVLVAGLLSFGVYKRLNKEDKKEDQNKNTAVEKKSIVKVKTITAKKQDLIKYITTTGTAKAIKAVNITSQISGEIEKLFVHESMKVKKGEILFKIKNDRYQLDLDEAKSRLLKAQIEYGIRKKRSQDSLTEPKNQTSSKDFLLAIKKLDQKLKNKQITAKEYDDQRLELEIKELFSSRNRDRILRSASGLTESYIAYKKAKLNYDNTIVKAPFDGYIANLKITEKQNISQGAVLMELLDYSKLKIAVSILENEISQIKKDAKVEINFSSYPQKTFEGKVKYLNPILDENTKTSKAIVEMSNKDLKIIPGMTANIVIDGLTYKDKLIVPKEAIITRDNRKLLFIVENNKAKWLYIETGEENFDYIEVLTKLKEGMQVIISNNYTLAHDANVEIIKKTP